ncbi:MAG: HlyD family efflux transporter periplasmic adaptor subunit [Candidatus Marinimicrobia bacterium]|jgi:multidrug efflux pump subunit AcrA (membrane-fusion protein)|nr:HlyD family efflux transporter periplasmic adaptor subunit [Candidatus Neomarinimicrobiota bacterium]MBT3633172.1 HlyD family efflux transporter periplasmic adaptor subunit [Candidatus Neomarinimicrobiota bacterium]MBT3682227.1 HlyD family efflux transporter periplasmic adaptor subunit [Candidatus Neomarinimicrobiota bacterium]MBT3758772.1 HlyD family efflux transporter periplasmic adaptor subunit [Candidatus Neomarinimicrobiota bacterium]MBT3895354.1 HlyD family efflux transporter periplasm
MKKAIRYIIAAIILIVIITIIRRSPDTDNHIIIQPEFGQFEVIVTSTGELQAKNSTDIRGPSKARMARIWNMKISDLVAEGTIVKAGDYVAELDKSELSNKIEESELNLQKLESQLIQAQLDSTLTLSAARNEIVNLGYSLEQQQLAKEQSSFEAPAIQRQAEINLEKAERSLVQAKVNYEIKVKQAIEKIKIVIADLDKEKSQHEIKVNVMDEFKIYAPENGIVIYAKEWNGKKKVVGSSISGWDPVVATLPDLSVMESVTFVNEVDIQKIKVDQLVTVTLDADPTKLLSGRVTSVANMGEQRPNSDSKVFEVNIEISESDSTLLPSLTTANMITIAKLDSVLYIPLESIYTSDSLSIVYKKNGMDIVRQEIIPGLVNDNYAVVKKGLVMEDKIYLSLPDDAAELDLIPLIND